MNINYFKIGIVAAALVLDIFNYMIYKRKYKVLISRYRNHPLNKKFKIWMLHVVGAGLFYYLFYTEVYLKYFNTSLGAMGYSRQSGALWRTVFTWERYFESASDLRSVYGNASPNTSYDAPGSSFGIYGVLAPGNKIFR